MFTERAANQRIFYVGSQQRLRREICHGDSATLKSGGMLVLVKNIRLLEPHGFSGEIYGFEPPSEEYAGYKVGQRVPFSERNVYSCSRGA